MLDSKSIWHTIIRNNILTDDRGLSLYGLSHTSTRICVDWSLEARTMDMVCYQATTLYVMFHKCSSPSPTPPPPSCKHLHKHTMRPPLKCFFLLSHSFLFPSEYNLLDVAFLFVIVAAVCLFWACRWFHVVKTVNGLSIFIFSVCWNCVVLL